MQQLLVTFGGNSFGYWPFAIISLVATIPFAMMSYYLVERPMLRLKGLTLSAMVAGLIRWTSRAMGALKSQEKVSHETTPPIAHTPS